MREMVSDVMHPLRWESREVAGHQRQERLPGVHLGIQVGGLGVEGVDAPIWGVVEPVGQFVDRVGRDARLGEAGRDRSLRESAPMRCAGEWPFSDAGDNWA